MLSDAVRTGRVDINFIKEGTSIEDIDLFLGPDAHLDDTEFFNEDGLLLAHLVFFTGVFPSVSQARKNGWNKPIPKGFSEFVIGKKKAQITILNLE